MFGYITPDLSVLDESRRARYREAYCGLCHVLYHRHGLTGSATLSNDLTFLAILLNALYEAEEEKGRERCAVHPFRSHTYIISEPFEYVADMNVALAYHKCMDNWLDDKNFLARGEAMLLKRAHARVAQQYPEKCAAIEAWLDEIHHIESQNRQDIDAPVNSTGRLMGQLFCWKDDFWSDSLDTMGNGLGRFIYMMDAYEDLPKDLRSGSYNPLASYSRNDNYETMCKDALMMMVADCTQEFEQLPILQDADILRNVLYCGIWSKYVQLQKKRETSSKGA